MSRWVRPRLRVRVPHRAPQHRSPVPRRRVLPPPVLVPVSRRTVPVLPDPVFPDRQPRHRVPGGPPQPVPVHVRVPRPPALGRDPRPAPRDPLHPLPDPGRELRPRVPVPVVLDRLRAASGVPEHRAPVTTRSPHPKAWASRVVAPARVVGHSPDVRVPVAVKHLAPEPVPAVCRVRVAPAGCLAPTRR